MPIITSITPQKKRKGRYSIFVDDEFFLGINEELLYKAKLKEGQEVDILKLKEIVTREEYSRAREYVLYLLSRRLYSCQEVRNKLKLKGYEEDTIETLIFDFVAKKYLDDVQFAKSWIETRIRLRPRGTMLLKKELSNKGISREVIRDSLQEIQSTDQQIPLAEAALRKKKNYQSETDPRKRLSKIYRFLGQKGFSSDIIKETARKVTGKLVESEDAEEES